MGDSLRQRFPKEEDRLSEELESAQESMSRAETGRSALQRIFVRKGVVASLSLPFLAVFTALVIGGIIIAASSADVRAAWGDLFGDPLGALSVTWRTARDAYIALFEGSFGSPARIVEAI